MYYRLAAAAEDGKIIRQAVYRANSLMVDSPTLSSRWLHRLRQVPVDINQQSYRALSYVGAIALAAASSLLIATPTEAAERIRFQLGLLGLSITRQELETFADTGELNGSLETVLSRLDSETRSQLQAVLQARYQVDAVRVNRFSYTQSGRQLLTEVGDLIQTESGQNGFYSLRAALTLAAADADGLTLLNFIRQFPTDIRVDVGQALAIARKLDTLLSQTQSAMADLAETTEAIATSEPATDFSALPDPRQPGTREVSMKTLTLYDGDRDRTLVVDVYTPVVEPSREAAQTLPVIVVSNGLGARRSRFDELAIHLASHGFAVAMPDHPGSDRQRLQAFYRGLHRENFEAAEYINRPLDISFLLDELTRLNPEEFGDRLDPSRVGVFGYSFGGTTALALAGAEINRSHLQQDCANRSALLNISLLYQCRALELADTGPQLQDDRVQAIYVFVPFGRSLYGPQGMAQVDRPVFWEATEQDILTPLVIEQLPPFGWLTNQSLEDITGRLDVDKPDLRSSEHGSSESQGAQGDRYLVVTDDLPHARLTLDVINRLTNQAIAWENIKPITERYHQMLSLIFFEVYLAANDTYRPYLQAQGMRYLETKPYSLYWRHDSPSDSL